MTDVIAWPPVGLTAWAFSRVDPVSESRGLIVGNTRTSSALPARRTATLVVGANSASGAGAGYMEVLKRLLEGGRHLIRAPHCAMAPRVVINSSLQNSVLDLVSGATEMNLTDGVDEVWMPERSYYGSATTSGGFPAIDVVNLPPGEIVARPGDRVVLLGVDGADDQEAWSLDVATSDGSGDATIRLTSAFTGDGPVSIGGASSVVYKVTGGLPEAVQPLTGDFTYTWSLLEVFEDEYSDGWTEVDPWR